MPRPLSEAGHYARSLGLTTEQVQRLGGMERVRSMPEDGRAILVGDFKRLRARQRRGRGLPHYGTENVPSEDANQNPQDKIGPRPYGTIAAGLLRSSTKPQTEWRSRRSPKTRFLVAWKASIHRMQEKGAVMSEKKIVIPEGMLKAVLFTPGQLLVDSVVVKLIVEAALRWSSDNLQMPTVQWVEEQIIAAHPQLTTTTLVRRCIAEWLRRMFVAPEPEVPEEIKDLLALDGMPQCDDRIIEAFRRGQKSK